MKSKLGGLKKNSIVNVERPKWSFERHEQWHLKLLPVVPMIS